MLTFEFDKKSEKLEIHFDQEGLSQLILQLKKLENHDKQEHIHLMTNDWGGEELTNMQQNLNANLIHHVAVYNWPRDKA